MDGAIQRGDSCRVLDDDLLNGIIRLLMRIDANVQALLDALTEEDGEDEEPES